MDLLTGYGSDASSDESRPDNPVSKQSATTAFPAGLLSSTVPPGPVAPPQTNQTVLQNRSNSNKKGTQRRKMLALNALLPPEIFERLTKRQLQVEDSDSDREEEQRQTEMRKSKTAPTSCSANNKTRVASSGLISLLQELRSTKASESSSHHGNDKNGTTSSTSGARPAEEECNSNPQQQKLGFAFTSVTTVNISSKEANDKVVNIHADADASPIVFSDEVNSVSEIDEATKSAPLEIQRKRPSTFRSEATAPVKMPVVRMTPRVQAAPIAHVFATQQPAPPSLPSDPYEDEASSDAMQSQALSTRGRRKEMERALRKGNLDQVVSEQPGLQTMALHQEVPSYHLDEYTHTQARAGQQKRDFVAVKMYDPKAGTTVDTMEVSSRHRAKHQIHQLAHSAIALEASRLTNPGRTNKGTSSRADAKRKYGW